MAPKMIVTRFRAYQLGNAGSSFSYYADGEFTLIEARLTDTNRPNVLAELNWCDKEFVDVLHITSWDQDHCSASELEEILDTLRPAKIEHPDYEPKSENGKASKQLIDDYKYRAHNQNGGVTVKSIGPDYIGGLNSAEDLGYKDILYWPTKISYENENDNSIVKFFRKGSFNVASLGDVEHENIGAMLKRSKTLEMEMDVLILAHHGADCATNSKKVFTQTAPKVAICSSNYDNQFNHPRDNVRQSLHELNIPLFTTKTGDVVIESLEPHNGRFLVSNLIANSSEISSTRYFTAKKQHWLGMNLDTLRNIFRKKRSFGR